MNILDKTPGEFDELYSKNDAIWTNDHSNILDYIPVKYDNGSKFLDLGCGQGRNSIYMAQRGFLVDSLDFSQVGLEHLEAHAKRLGVQKNIKTICSDILNNNIELSKYDIVSCIDVVSGWTRKKGLDYIEQLKSGVSLGSLLIITGYLKDDAFFEKNPEGLFFDDNELLNMFSDFSVKKYIEDSFVDEPHEGFPYLHKHSFCKIIVQKE